jgi:hypothetical protein
MHSISTLHIPLEKIYKTEISIGYMQTIGKRLALPAKAVKLSLALEENSHEYTPRNKDETLSDDRLFWLDASPIPEELVFRMSLY